jgi:hypothetical protein
MVSNHASAPSRFPSKVCGLKGTLVTFVSAIVNSLVRWSSLILFSSSRYSSSFSSRSIGSSSS